MQNSIRRSVSSSSFNSSKNHSSGIVETGSGHVHYIERSVNFGLQTLKENESLETTTNTRHTKLGQQGRRTKSEGNLFRITDHYHQQIPLIGEQRHVILDMQWTKFGFRLQSYNRMSERGKAQRTIVHKVTPGSPAFMAGLHQGDCIIEVNGKDMRYADPDEIVQSILSTKGKRVHLIVEFIDGVRILELKKNLSELKNKLIDRQKELKELLSSKHCPTSHKGKAKHTIKYEVENDSYILDPEKNLSSDGVEMPQSPSSPSFSPSASITDLILKTYKVATYTGDILDLACDVLITPLGKPVSENTSVETKGNSELITCLLQAGGDKLINELSLASYCKLGEVISTTSGELSGIKNIYHCVFGTRQEHLVSCCANAFDTASQNRELSIAFWLDGFVSKNVSPSVVLEIVSLLNKENQCLDKFGAVIMAGSCLPEVDELVYRYFPN